jgi:protein-tyrosine phosphatase
MLEDKGGIPDDLGELYRRMLRTTAPALVRIAHLIATRPAPILVHCTAGKDRTGLAVAVVLAAVGVPRERVVEDYGRTRANMPGVLERIATDPRMPGGPDMIERVQAERPQLLDAPGAAMASALDELDGAGGAAAWLRGHGLSDADLRRLRERLVGPS